MWTLSIQRRDVDSPFDFMDIRKVQAHLAHIKNAAVIAHQLDFARTRTAADILERHGRQVITLGPGGKVIAVSDAAATHLTSAFRINQGMLEAAHPPDRPAFESLVHSLCNIHTKTVASPKPVLVRRSNHAQPLVVYGCPLPEIEKNIFFPAVALLVILDPDRPLALQPELIMSYFGVTRAEARLAAAMFSGIDLDTHARQSGIGTVTARNHLQGLLRKTGVHSKAELITALTRIFIGV
jgi:DNA-binding CsgD family transcriptional regulator